MRKVNVLRSLVYTIYVCIYGQLANRYLGQVTWKCFSLTRQREVIALYLLIPQAYMSKYYWFIRAHFNTSIPASA